MIEPQLSVQEFFRMMVVEAIKALKVEVSGLAEFYLVNLLKDYTKTENVYSQTDSDALALILKEALEAEPKKRLELLKKMGDFSLYISGFFPESLTKSLVDTDYYKKMGKNAYEQLSEMMSTYKHMSSLYLELAMKFALMSQILMMVSKEGQERNYQELLNLYENWAKTGDKDLEEFLAKQGFTLDKTLVKKIH